MQLTEKVDVITLSIKFHLFSSPSVLNRYTLTAPDHGTLPSGGCGSLAPKRDGFCSTLHCRCGIIVPEIVKDGMYKTYFHEIKMLMILIGD